MVLRSAKPPTPIFIIPCSTLPLVTTAPHPPSREGIRDGRIPLPIRFPALRHPDPSAF